MFKHCSFLPRKWCSVLNRARGRSIQGAVLAQEFKYTWEHTAGSPDLRGKQVFSGGGVSIPVYGTMDKAGTVTWVCDGKKMKPVKCEAVVEGENDGQVHSGVYWRLDGKGNKTARLGEFTGVRTQAPSDTLR